MTIPDDSLHLNTSADFVKAEGDEPMKVNDEPINDEEADAIQAVIKEGNKLLELDHMTADMFQPRNSLVTVRRLGRLEDGQRVGQLHMPAGFGKFDVAEVILVGPGEVLSGPEGTLVSTTADLESGMTVLIKTEKPVMTQAGGRHAATTLQFTLGKDKIDLINQHEILTIISSPNSSVE